MLTAQKDNRVISFESLIAAASCDVSVKANT